MRVILGDCVEVMQGMDPCSNGPAVPAGTRGLVGGGQGVYRPVNSESGEAQT